MLEVNPVPSEVIAVSSEVSSVVTAAETAVASSVVPLVMAVCLAVLIAVVNVWSAVCTDWFAVWRLVRVIVPVGESFMIAWLDCIDAVRRYVLISRSVERTDELVELARPVAALSISVCNVVV